MSKPSLAFILPVYRPDLVILERCVKSLVEQSLKDFEAVFVLDGPCPEAEPVIRKLKGAKIVEIEHGGACRARNEGFKHTTADLVVFWDSDSAIECDAARAWVDQFNTRPDIGFIYSGYRFFDEKGGYASEEFDPWMLRVNNYISTCFPMRRELFPGWNESLLSLQDWDLWLSVVEKGAKGLFLPGYAFSTAYPTPKSISGEGCTPQKWLERADAVKKLHNIPLRTMVVSAIGNKHEGVRLAKLLDADYMELPMGKPNHYKTVIQVGFSFRPSVIESHASVFGPVDKVRNVLFWTKDNITEAYNLLSRKALDEWTKRLNEAATQYVEDIEGQRIMERCGFKVQVMPMPLVNTEQDYAFPATPSFLMDIDPQYSLTFNAIEKALPDINLEMVGGFKKIEDYSGLIHFHLEPTLTQNVKRMLLSGRHVVSNIKQPFTGFMNDRQDNDSFIPEMVERLRDLAGKSESNTKAKEYYARILGPQKFLESVNAQVA